MTELREKNNVYFTKNSHPRVITKIPGPSKTKQSFKDDCDINNILKKFNQTGMLPEMIQQNPQYGDFSDVPTYQEAANTVIMAQTQFNALPAKTRDRFMNDPAKFLEFVQNEANLDEMVRMGLAIAPPPESPSEGDSAPKNPAPAKGGE